MSTLSLLEQVNMYIFNYRPDILEKFNWKIISKHKSISWNFVYANKEQKWDMYYLSRNPNITWAIVTANTDWD
jgi:hypothetical protein